MFQLSISYWHRSKSFCLFLALWSWMPLHYTRQFTFLCTREFIHVQVLRSMELYILHCIRPRGFKGMHDDALGIRSWFVRQDASASQNPSIHGWYFQIISLENGPWSWTSKASFGIRYDNDVLELWNKAITNGPQPRAAFAEHHLS